MKIVYCIQDNYRLGGMERVLALKANYLAQHGFDVHIITTDQQGKPSYFELNKNIQCHDLHVNYTLSKNRRQYHNCIKTHKERLDNLLKALKANIVISMFSQETEFLPTIHDGSRKVLELHYSYRVVMPHLKGLKGLYHAYKNKKRAMNIKKYDKFIVLTHEDMETWKGFENITVIPNAQTFTCVHPAELNNKRVVAVGRYHLQKAYDRLIDAWNKISDLDGWTLHLIGEGDLRESLQKQINQLGLSQSVFLDGASLNVKQEYLKSSVFVLTSLYEGFGLVILEAMTCGVPVVSFDCPCGPRDLIKNGENGFLVSNGDIEGLANKLRYLMTHSDERKRMGMNAFEDAKEYSVDKVMAKWINLFNELQRNV